MVCYRDETELVRGLKAGEEEAFTELVRQYQAIVFRVSVRMIRDRAEAEEIAQEVFIRTFQKIDTFRSEASLKTWILRITTNTTINRIHFLNRRGRKRKQELQEWTRSQSQLAPDTTRPDDVLIAERYRKRIEEAIGMLSEEHRSVLVLRDVEGLAYEEVQAITELSLGTVKSRLYRARRALQENIRTLEKAGKK